MSYEKHANSGGAPLFENLRKLINVIDDLRDVGLHKYISLPRIAVLGTQSSGKSSLLESIVGMDFLPRGDGVVTRRPLELRLVRSLKIKTPYGEFEQIKGEKFEDFAKIKEKIEWLTDSVAGKDKGIVDDPIILTVYSPSCPDLTIIDLPGITRIPIAGQAKNIEEITKTMCARYCKDDRTIILCVIPANQDLSVSEGLQMAKDLDPKGDRTLAVLTKIDIMDRGTNAKKVLQNQEIHLRYGFVGVKNRSQFDIQTGIKVKQALENEKNFFMGHPIYSTMPGNVGTEALVQKLTVILYSQIRKCLPDIIREINNRTKEAEDRLKELGEPLPSTDTEKLQLLWNMITEFTEKFKNVIKGKYDGSRVGDQKEISSGTRIKGYFYDIYKEFYEKDKIDIDYSDGDISRAIRLHQGDAIPGFLSIDSFLYLIHPLLQRLKEPAYECLTGIYSHLEDLARGILTKVFERFPQISEEIVDSVIKILQERRDNTREIIDNIMEYENSYIFTNDDAYVSKTNVIPQSQPQTPSSGEREKKPAPIDANTFFVHEMRNRIEAYYSVVVRNARDTIPKTIGYFMVRKAMEEMQYSLYNAITKNPLIFKLVGEPEHIVLERTNANKLLETLRKAQKVLKRDPDLAVMPTVEDTEDLMDKVTKKDDRKKVEEEKHEEKLHSRQQSSSTIDEPKKTAPAPAPTQPPAQPVPAQPVTTAPTDKKPPAPVAAGGNLFGNAAPAQPKPTTASSSLFGDNKKP